MLYQSNNSLDNNKIDVNIDSDDVSNVLDKDSEGDNNVNDTEFVDQKVIENKTSYVGVIVFLICLLSLRLIFHVVHKFKKKVDKDTNKVDCL